MTGDRELLKLAAKAAGMKLIGARDLGTWEWAYHGDSEWGLYRHNANGTQTRWNPLLSDGDALRLAVKLKFMVSINAKTAGKWIIVYPNAHEILAVEEEVTDDWGAATRRAIVRAAAEIGKTTP